ncbi:phosphatase PAP2 family protein [Lactobacillus psittaci]|uniref:PAP2 family protein n=1 Tax=Lactobacillus psittaci DSM 15354 TaxID=1122152 RepID=A0A0R1SCI6_9LACO|nr:phosphatase PAP2 family protein [Lactobacillus psittaci]KRL63763.1 PAP2 family protein [Lactobacillus psittaci DSM 15354]
MNENENRFTYLVGATLIFTCLYVFWVHSVVKSLSFIHSFDNSLINLITNSNQTELFILKHLTVLANTSMVVIYTIILVLLLLWRKHYDLAKFAVFVMALANGNNWLIKHLVMRHRPSVHHLVKATGYSFPSGHSAGSMSLCLVLFIVVLVLMKKGKLKNFLLICLPIIPLIIGMSRIYVRVHYPSDVLGGFIEAITFFLLGLLIFQSKLFKTNNK